MKSISNYIREGIYGNLGLNDDLKIDWVNRYNNQFFGDGQVGGSRWNCPAKIQDDGSVLFANGFIIADKDLLTGGMLPAFNFILGKQLRWVCIGCKEFRSFKGLFDNVTGINITNMRIFENSINDKEWVGVDKIANLHIYDLPDEKFMKALLSWTTSISNLMFYMDYNSKYTNILLPYITKQDFSHCKQISLEGIDAKKINPNEFVDAIAKNSGTFGNHLQIVLTQSPMIKFEPLKTKIKGSLYLYITPEYKIDTPEKAIEFVDGINDNWNNALTSIGIKSPGMITTTALTGVMEKHIRSKFTFSPVITLQR